MSRQWSDLGPIKIKIKTFTCKFQSRHGPVPCCSHSRWTHPRWLSCLDQPEQKQLRWTRQQSKIFLFFSLRELLGPQLFCSDRIATRTCSIASRDVFPSLRFTTNISNATFLSDPSPIIGNACQWLTPSLTNSCLVNLIDLPWHVKMTTQNLLRLLVLLMLMMRNVLATAWCRFGRWGLVIKLSFCPDFEHKASKFGQDFEVDFQVRFRSWSLVIILLLMLVCGY